MRPSRCAAKTAESRDVIHSLAYALNTMVEREAPCTQGVVFLANMDDFTMSNFATDYWFQLMSILQGNLVPVRVNLFLIVSPPEWFGTILNIMKTMSTPDFQERLKMISEFELPQYLAAGYEEFLPNDMTTGEALTDELVGDFVEYRKAIEAAQGHNNANVSLARQQSTRLGSSSSRDLGSSLNRNSSSLRRSLSLQDSDSSLSRSHMTKNSSNGALGASEKPPMSNKQQRPGMQISRQRSISALALDVRMNMSMPSLMSRQKSAKRHSSGKTANSSQTNEPNNSSAAPMSKSVSLKHIEDCMGGDDGDDNSNNSDSSLNLFDLEKTSDDNSSISENTGTVDDVKAAASSTSRIPSTLCW